VLWGLVPINNVDTKVMAKGAKDFEIRTEMNAHDVVINSFTSAVTVYSRTVEVNGSLRSNPGDDGLILYASRPVHLLTSVPFLV
jgi:hypothetical protein